MLISITKEYEHVYQNNLFKINFYPGLALPRQYCILSEDQMTFTLGYPYNQERKINK